MCEVMITNPSAVVRKYNFYDMRAKNVSIGRFNARLRSKSIYKKSYGKISAHSHPIVKQICFPKAMYCFCIVFSLQELNA